MIFLGSDIIKTIKNISLTMVLQLLKLFQFLRWLGYFFDGIFFAIPVLGQFQRDTARKNNAHNILAAAIQFKTNNVGRIPFNGNNDTWTKLKLY